MHYHDTDDHRFSGPLRNAAPTPVRAFLEFDRAVFEQDGALSRHLKELIAVAVASTTQCPYCIDAHSKAARTAGATEEEVAEAVMISAALRAGGSFTHGWLALKAFRED